MVTRTSEIAPGIYKFSTWVSEIAPPAGFTYNRYLIDADEPLLFHTGPRAMFEDTHDAVSRIIPVTKLRWISFGHVEADECGSMNQWLAAAPHAQIAQGQTACDVSLNDLADRAPRVLGDNEVLDLGGKRVRWLDTPHVPHAWESGVMFEETTATLFTGDLFTQIGDGPAITATSIVADAIRTEELFDATSVNMRIGPTIRRLAKLEPGILAVMHGSCFQGEGGRELSQLAEFFEGVLKRGTATARG